MSEWLFNMSIKFYTSPKILYPPKQISGYAPTHHLHEYIVYYLQV